MKLNIETPWGPAEDVTNIADGIDFISTAGHGGYRLSLTRVMEMPEPYRSYEPFCGRAGWYEEDCDWCVVALAYPQFFPPHVHAEARRMWDWMQARKVEQEGVAA